MYKYKETKLFDFFFRFLVGVGGHYLREKDLS